MEPRKNDFLTGLATRKQLEEMFSQLIKQESCRFAIVLIDIDGLAYYNYHYGHIKSDEILQQIARLISQQIPPTATAFRIGGDEFIILLIESNSTEVMSVIERIRQLIENQFSHLVVQKNYKTFESSLTVSCGIAFYPDNGDELDTILAAADNAMYQEAKQQGGNKIAVAKALFILG